jgi:starvation-inducible DNA-binding protein
MKEFHFRTSNRLLTTVGQKRYKNGDVTMSTAVNRGSSPAIIATWVDFDPGAAGEISGVLTNLLADVFALYLKTKGFHWHISGRHFYDYHSMLDEQADQILATMDAIAERVRKIRGRTISSIGEVSRWQRLMDTQAGELSPEDMLAELYNDNVRLRGFMREAHVMCEEDEDVASASVLENWIDEPSDGSGFLYEVIRD